MTGVLSYLLDETEFLSEHGVRCVSRIHAATPYIFPPRRRGVSGAVRSGGKVEYAVRGELELARTVWFPVTYLLVEALERYGHFYGDSRTVECPAGSGSMRTLGDVAAERSTRLSRLFRAPTRVRAVRCRATIPTQEPQS